jgi:hypothetical protein
MKGVLVALTICFCASIAALAQDSERLRLVGVMVTGSAANSEQAMRRFREGLAALAQRATRTIPIIAIAGDFVAEGSAVPLPDELVGGTSFSALRAALYSTMSAPLAKPHPKQMTRSIGMAFDFVFQLMRSCARCLWT